MNLAGGFRFSSSLVAILDAGDGRVVDVNPAFERELGYSRDAMLGRSTLEIDFWPHPQTRATIWAHLRSEHRVCGERVVFRNLARSEFAANLYCEFFEHEGRRLVLAVFQRLESAAAQDAPVEVDPGSYRSLFMSSAEGFYRSLPEGGLIDVNPALARIFGYESPAQMLSEAHDRRARDLYADPAVAVSLIERLHADGHFENQRVQIRRRDGSVVWISENSRCVRDGEGHLLFYEGSIMDIGAQVEAEERLRQSENMYRTLVDSSHDGVFLIRHDGSIGFINEAMAQTLGYRADELIGTNYLKLIAPEAMAEQTVRRNERAGGSYAVQTYDTVMIRKDGTRRLLHVHAGAVDYEGEVASTGTARDVTEEHRQREALEWAERTYRELFQNAVSGMFRSHLDGRIVAANDAFARILGYADASELLESGRGISARRRAEIALKDSEARYRTLVEHSQVGVYMMLEDRYTYVNAAFAALFGYREDELVGSDFRLLVPPESLEHQEDRYRRRSGGEPSNGDYCIVLMRKDGARIQVVVSAGQVEMHGKRYTSGTIRDVTAQLRVQRELEHNASHDQLTGLSNRVYFERQLEQAIAHAHASGDYHYAVLFLDLDGFKLVNDSLGHASGDDLLMQIAETLSANLGTQCLVARYGGDEFTLLPHGVCPRGRAEQLAQRVLALLAGSFEVRGHRVFSGASVGVVLGHADYQSPDQLLRDADTAMYRAKAGGKSAYVIFDDAMHAAARERLKLETDLRFAVERGEFRIFHQPIVDLRNGRVQGFEALVRWEHPQRGLLLPGEFLEVAGETGTLVAMDWWVLEQVCQNLLRWQRRLPAHARLRASVNIDDRQFADQNLIEHLRNVLRRTGADPSTLALEITETVFRRGREEAAQTLHGLKQLGVSLVVDDFGTGYSSLDSFAESPFDALKIDRSFVRDMVSNFRHRAIVRTIAAFAEDMHLDLIAEGVETAEQADLLRDLGCIVAQGFLYAPALPLDQFEALLERGFARQNDSPPSAVA